jgi:hypothetical protein
MFHTIGTFAIYTICTLFLVGMAGSAVVVLLSFFDDFTQLFSNEEVDSFPRSPPTT